MWALKYVYVRSYTALLDDFQSHKDFYVRPPHKVCGKTFVYFHYLIQAKVYKSFSAHFIIYIYFNIFLFECWQRLRKKYSYNLAECFLWQPLIASWRETHENPFIYNWFFSKVCQNKFVTISSVYLSLKCLQILFLHTGRVHRINHGRGIPALCRQITPGMSTHFFLLTLKLVFE